MRISFVAFWLGFLLIGCSSVPAPATETSTPRATAAPHLSPTSVQMPFDPNAGSDDYCKPPFAVMQVQDGDDISENEIVYELVKIWLNRYNQPNAPPACRIDGYTIEKVYESPAVSSQVLEPRGDFRRVVEFSVKLTQIPSDWMSFPGELDQDNWLHIGQIVAVSQTSDGYQMEFAYP